MIQLQSRPRVLLIGACSDPTLRDIAEVTCIPGKEYEEEKELIERAVAEKGPFDAFGVSPSSLAAWPLCSINPLAHSWKADQAGIVRTRRQIPDEVGFWPARCSGAKM